MSPSKRNTIAVVCVVFGSAALIALGFFFQQINRERMVPRKSPYKFCYSVPAKYRRINHPDVKKMPGVLDAVYERREEGQGLLRIFVGRGEYDEKDLGDLREALFAAPLCEAGIGTTRSLGVRFFRGKNEEGVLHVAEIPGIRKVYWFSVTSAPGAADEALADLKRVLSTFEEDRE